MGMHVDKDGNPLASKKLVFNDGRTKQSFKDQCDINKILKKAQRTGSLAFANKYDQQVFGEFEGYDLLEAHERIKRAENIFNELPSEVRREFANNAFAFIEFANDPENQGRLVELLPQLAEPDAYFPNPVRRQAPPGDAAAPGQVASADAEAAATPPGDG